MSKIALGYLAYQRMLLTRAGQAAVAFAKEHALLSGVALAGGVIALLLTWQLVPNVELRNEIVETAIPLIAGATILFAAFLVFYLRSGMALFKEVETRARFAEAQLEPKLELTLPGGEAFCNVAWGTTTETFGGHRQTNISHSQMLIFRLTCTNLSTTRRITNCRATLMNVMRVSDDGELIDLGFRESVALAWDRDRAQKEVDLEPRSSRPIYVVSSRKRGALVLYAGAELPVEYHQFIMKPGRYRLTVQVSGESAPVEVITFDLTANDDTGEITGSVIASDLRDPLRSTISGDRCDPTAGRYYGELPNRPTGID